MKKAMIAADEWARINLYQRQIGEREGGRLSALDPGVTRKHEPGEACPEPERPLWAAHSLTTADPWECAASQPPIASGALLVLVMWAGPGTDLLQCWMNLGCLCRAGEEAAAARQAGGAAAGSISAAGGSQVRRYNRSPGVGTKNWYQVARQIFEQRGTSHHQATR